ncbi:MAG: flagellar hook-length control protein [Thermoanaerobaculia bacterium]
MKTVTRMLIAVTITTLSAALAWSQPQEDRSSAPAASAQAIHKGLTWKLLSTNSTTGTVDVGCWNGCDAYHGDTACKTALPILCIKKSGPGFPLPKPASVDDSSQYHRWAGGVVGTTKPTVPPSTRADADALCVKEFGADWRVAEHHDGWGWHFQAFGGVGKPAQKFWVDINDQPGATCWH